MSTIFKKIGALLRFKQPEQEMKADMSEMEHMPEPGQMTEMEPMMGMEPRPEMKPEEHGSSDMAEKPGKKKPDQM
jgi:hypothetical protein